MRLEEEELRALARLTSVTPEYATTIAQRLELLAIYRATEQVKSKSLAEFDSHAGKVAATLLLAAPASH